MASPLWMMGENSAWSSNSSSSKSLEIFSGSASGLTDEKSQYLSWTSGLHLKTRLTPEVLSRRASSKVSGIGYHAGLSGFAG